MRKCLEPAGVLQEVDWEEENLCEVSLLPPAIFQIVTSFLKEELLTDEDKYPSKFAKGSATLTKYNVVQRVLDVVVEADKMTPKVLAHAEALECWNALRSGWVLFHVAYL
ncbi:hypothetical protein PM082_013853 [Marasmius tenuissimus]|nr:hypothetical protein PM082_013853 [Marasmius tenuissimus]